MVSFYCSIVMLSANYELMNYELFAMRRKTIDYRLLTKNYELPTPNYELKNC